jgi:NAD(P)-dependent dehydrogenase (short-subunit alcohol dehydrogenase family)
LDDLIVNNSLARDSAFGLRGKRVLVIGGTSGIGKTIALALSDEGANVVASSRRQEEVEKTAAEIISRGRKTLVHTVDVCHRDQVARLVEATRAELGGIDVLVNCAGTSARIPSLETPEDGWDQVLDITLTGTWRACQIVGHLMKEQGGGKIINIASLSSFVALYEVTPYCVSKAGVAMLTKCLAIEWAQYNINVNAIAPGVFETPLNRELINEPNRKASILSRTPMKRFGQLHELVGAALYLSSDLSSFVTGDVMVVDGGFLAQGIGP